MSVSKLHVFQKNTDATASLAGYYYQVLKTVETWMDNFNRGIDDEIYCDFEEDIFQINRFSKTAKFRQIKLYSSNFSFASDEINKCIAHFFMLHVKTDYTSFDKEFVFEANTAVAQKKGANDAELLKEWEKNQDKLEGELLQKCVGKIKEIVSQYINEQTEILKDKVAQDIIKEALDAFKAIKNEEWELFTKKIKWQFKGVSSDIEFASLKESIESLIVKLPFLISDKEVASVFGLLHTSVWEHASALNPDDKKLTLPQLQQILLNVADDEDKWYWSVFERWEKVTTIDNFSIGEFYEVIDATRHCRHNPYLIKHDKLWLSILKTFINDKNISDSFKRTAIYEFLWLRFRPLDIYEKPAGDLNGEKEYFDFYFQDFGAFRNARELEDAQSLMNIAFASCNLGITDLSIDYVKTWFAKVEETLKARLEKETNPNEICHLLENLGTHYLFLNAREKEGKNISEVITPLGKIFSYINQADFYNATTLASRLNKYISLLILVDPVGNVELIESIEEFTERLNPVIEKRSGAFQVGMVEVDKGIQYLKSKNPGLMLKALNCFHKAKALWYQQERIEGFVLSLLSIAELYSAIGMNLAAKYYALGAAWACIYNGSRYLMGRIADAFGVVFATDFRQGAWMNAIISFADYMNARDEFKGIPLDPETDKMPFKVMADFAIILHSTPKISPQLKVLIDTHIGFTGELGDTFIKPLFPELENQYPTDLSLKPLLEEKLTDKPLNDLGAQRMICFNALGSKWQITFSNDYQTNAIAEEFCGMMQIMLAEIALSKYDFHLVRGSIKISLEVGTKLPPYEREPSHTEFKWKAYIEYLDSAVSEEVNAHTVKTAAVLIHILAEISLLPITEFRKLLEGLFTESDLAGKTFVLGLYQRMYRFVFTQPKFDSLQRQFFNPVDVAFLDLPKTNLVMDWRKDFSQKYKPQDAIENIKNRFKNTNPCIYLTIAKLKKDKNSPLFVNDLRGKGWMDWQIILTIMNFMLNYKAGLEVEKQSFDNEEEQREAHNNAFNKFLHMDEKDCYVEFPLKAFETVDFEIQLNHTLVLILNSYGLENNASFPNFTPIKEFLDIRFNMKSDSINENNPLADIV